MLYSYREDVNLVKFINDDTALVQDIMELEYLFGFEKGGQKDMNYKGKLCTAAHPDQFFKECYLKYNDLNQELIWLFSDKYNQDNFTYNITEVQLCNKDPDGYCRYKSSEGNKLFITHVIIIDIGIAKKKIFELVRDFDNPEDIVILIASERQMEVLYSKSLNQNKKTSVSIYHKIEYKCELLHNEGICTLVLLLTYLFSLILWTYRNTFHYPHTVTIVQRMMTIPPSFKFVLMFGNYLLFSLCPWENPNIKMYLILCKILLNLISESLLVGFLFSITFGFKIVRRDLSVKYFVTLLVCMLMNYLVIFILMVFDQYHKIGTILYSILNSIFVIISTAASADTICRLKTITSNTREIQRVISEKTNVSIQTGLLIIMFYMLEVFYHGILALL